MKIGISCYPTYGGSGVVASELALHLVARGHSVHVLSYELPARLEGVALTDGHRAAPLTPEIASEWSENNSTMVAEESAAGELFFHRVEVKEYPLFGYPPYSLALANEMVQVARRFHLDLMHVHYAVPNAVSALLAKQILSPQRLPVVTTLHGTDITLVGNDPSYLETTRWSIEQSDEVTAVSPWLEAETRSQFANGDGPLERDISVIPNFVEAERFSACTPVLGEEPLLVHVSNYRRVKQPEIVVEAFARLRQRRPCRLRMVGEGPQRPSAEAKAKELGVAGAIEWRGNDPKIEQALEGCALFLLPSRLESFGLAALEALAAGVPVVCTNVGGLGDVVLDGETGRLVPLSNDGRLPDALADAAASILETEDGWQKMSDRGRGDARKRFSVDKVLDQYLEVYRRCVS